MDQQSDEDLVKAAKNGDMRAFGVIVERNEGKVAGVVKSMLGDTHEAMDVGQEVFIRFYKALEKFKGQSSISTYLLRIAINLSLNELNRRKKRNSLFRTEEAGLHVSAEHTQNDLDEAVRHEVDKLDPDFKAVVILRMIEGYSTEETADILKIPMGTALSRLSRAQKKLKTMLSKYLDL
jgi:RNA polymerase sigma-70 factor, ECF subfamily